MAVDRGVEPRRAARVSRVGPAVGHVDDDEGRTDPEAEPVLEDAAFLVVGVDRSPSRRGELRGDS